MHRTSGPSYVRPGTRQGDNMTANHDHDAEQSGHRATRSRAGAWWRVRPIGWLGSLVLVAFALIGPLGGAGAEDAEKNVTVNPPAGTPGLFDVAGKNFKQVAEKFEFKELPLTIPGLGDIGAVNIPNATLTVVRPDGTPLQIGGWILRLEGEAKITLATQKSLKLKIELIWESEEGDFTPVVKFEVTSTGALTVDEVLAMAGLLQPGAAQAATIDKAISVSGFTLAFQFDYDGDAPRSWFDATGKVTVGKQNLALRYLLSGDKNAKKGDYFIAALRLDNTGLTEDRVKLSELVKGNWGEIAADLELPEFVLAKVFGLEDGVSLGRTDLRLKSPQFSFFTGCDECGNTLPDDLELDADMSILAKLDLKAFGPVVADAFGYPDDDSIVDLYGRLGLTFSVIGGDPDDSLVSLDRVALKAKVPPSSTVNAFLPDWLSLGAWTVNFDYNADPVVGGITVGAGATATVAIGGPVSGPNDFEFTFDALATFTKTSDGTISVGVAAESDTAWNKAFGLEWLDLTGIGLGFSYTKASTGQTVFDAFLSSKFELEVAGRPNPTVGKLEARLGISDDVGVKIRVSFGEDGTDVPIGAVLAVVGDAVGAPPKFGETVAGLVLQDLALAVTVQTSGKVKFEMFANAANVPLLDDITGYLYVETTDDLPRFFFGLRPTGDITLGKLLAPPPPAGSTTPAATVPAVLDTIKLPTLGVIAAPLGGFTAQSTALTPDGLAFFEPLYGCKKAPAPGEPTPPAGSGTAPCAFKVDLEPGVNLVANIAFPDEFNELAKGLWLDPATGIQFQGTLSLPGIADPDVEVGVKLGLKLRLPRVVPGDRVEFIIDGALTLGIEAEITPNSQRIALFIEGELNTRWRRGAALLAGQTCPLGVPMPELEQPDAGAENPTRCYDLLTFKLKGQLELSLTGLSVSLTGGLTAPEGWQHPFGLPGFEWLVINQLTAKLEIIAPAPTGGPLAVNVGFLGEIEIDNGNPATSNTVLKASFGAGVSIQTIPAPPTQTFVPNFKGIRAYVSRIGMSDVVTLQQMFFPASQGVFDLAGLPDVEFQNVELMFAIAADADLCLEPRIGLAGELWIDPQRPGAGGLVPETPGCAPFGAGVDPAECVANRDKGCFSSLKSTIGLDGIIASGSLGSFQLGPISWDNALMDFRLKLGEAPILAVRGGVTVEGLGAGALSLKVELLPPNLEFFGYLKAFEVFEAQVEGKLGLKLNPLFPPKLEADLDFRAALGVDFDSFLRNAVATELQRIAAQLEAFDEALALLAADPIGNLAEARDALVEAGVAVPDWVDGVIEAVEFVQGLLPKGSPLPTYDQLLNGEEVEFVLAAWPGLFGPWCFIGGELDTAADPPTCTYKVKLPKLSDYVDGFVPPSWTAAFADVERQVVAAIVAIDLVPSISGLGITEYLDGLSSKLADARFFSVQCAEFDWTKGQGAGQTQIRILLDVLGTEYGFNPTFDLTSPAAGVSSVVTELLKLFLQPGQDPVECVGEQAQPDWLDELDDGAGAVTPTTLTLTPVGPLDEGEAFTLVGSISPAVPADAPIDITINWGDGSDPVVLAATGSSFSAGHTYVDDNPSGVSSAVYSISANTPTATRAARTNVTVNNVAPANLVLDFGDFADKDGNLVALEGSEVTVTGTFQDPGIEDTHTVRVTWGDGTTTRLQSGQVVHQGGGVWKFSATHTYRDDNPSGTPSDPYKFGIVIVDDDRGRLVHNRVITVENVDPSGVTVTPLIGGPGQPTRIDEGIEVSYRIDWHDPGVDDTFLVEVDFGEGPATRDQTADQSIVVTHVYRDDDPTGTPVDVYMIQVRVTDDDTGVGTGSTTVQVHNVDPVVTLDVTDLSTQYSDPIGGIPSTGEYDEVIATFEVYDVVPDILDVEVSFGGTTGLVAWLDLREEECVANGDYHHTCSWSLVQRPDPVSGIYTDIAPGEYEVVFTVNDDDTGTGSASLTIEVLPEDARVWYVGPTFAATTSARDGSATLELRSTIRDITSAVAPDDADWDPWPGDIRNASMRFDNRDTSPPAACSAARVDEVFNPFEVFLAERSIGVGSCDWLADIGNKDAVEFVIGTVVGGYYVGTKAMTTRWSPWPSRSTTSSPAAVTSSWPTPQACSPGPMAARPTSGHT
jgi:hypothetical protein